MAYRVIIYGYAKDEKGNWSGSQHQQVDVIEMQTAQDVRNEARKALTSTAWWKELDTPEYTGGEAEFIAGEGEDETLKVAPIHAFCYERGYRFVNGK